MIDEELKINLLTIAHGITVTNKQLINHRDPASTMLVSTLFKVQEMIKNYVIYNSFDLEGDLINDKQK